MARKLRVQYPGAIYHPPWLSELRRDESAFAEGYAAGSGMNRGDRRETIFEDDADREKFLQRRNGGSNHELLEFHE